jgi:hypothetical protein
MLYSFNAYHAREYGVDESIMLHNILYWLQKNKANKTNFRDGKYWTYNSASAFTELFPFWNERKIARILSSLEKQGAIECGNFNRVAYDRTKWFSSPLLEPFDKSGECIYQKCPTDRTNLVDGFTSFVRPIPYSKPNRKEQSAKKVEKQVDEALELDSANTSEGTSLGTRPSWIGFEDTNGYALRNEPKEGALIRNPHTGEIKEYEK